MSQYFTRGGVPAEVPLQERCYITELCNTADIPECSLAIARVESGITTQLHALTDVEEVYIVIEGEGEMQVGEERFPVSEGDRVTIPAGVPQRITAGDQRDLRFYCLCRPRWQPECYVSLEQ